MIKSMTAYARSEIQATPRIVRVEVRTYNSRHLDLSLKLTHGYESLEDRVKGVVAASLARGRVDLRVQIQDQSDQGCAFEVNLPRARAYCAALVQLGHALSLTAPLSVETLLAAGGMVQPLEVEKPVEAVWPSVETGLKLAMADLDNMRQMEGDHLAQDFSGRLTAIETMLDQIGAQAAGLPEMMRQRLQARIASLTEGVVAIDPARIAQEAALLADRSDIAEEMVRAASHLRQFRSLMAGDAPAGRPLNFLLQELNREFNTMGSKSAQAAMSHIIVAAKSELEKLREQVQNVE